MEISCMRKFQDRRVHLKKGMLRTDLSCCRYTHRYMTSKGVGRLHWLIWVHQLSLDVTDLYIIINMPLCGGWHCDTSTLWLYLCLPILINQIDTQDCASRLFKDKWLSFIICRVVNPLTVSERRRWVSPVGILPSLSCTFRTAFGWSHLW